MLAAWDLRSRRCDSASRDQQMQATLETFGEVDGSKRVERGGSGVPAKTSVVLLTYRQFRGVKAPSPCNGRKPVCARSLALVQAVGSLPTGEPPAAESALPHLGENDDTGEGERDSSSSSADFCGLSPPSKLVPADGQMRAWQVWFPGARANKGSEGQGEAHVLSWWAESAVPLAGLAGWKAAEQLSSAGGPTCSHHAPALQPPALSARQPALKAAVIPPVLCEWFRSYRQFLLRGVL